MYFQNVTSDSMCRNFIILCPYSVEGESLPFVIEQTGEFGLEFRPKCQAGLPLCLLRWPTAPLASIYLPVDVA